MSTGRMGSLKRGQEFPAPKQASGHEGIIMSGMCGQTFLMSGMCGQTFLNSASDGGEWPATCTPERFTSRTKIQGTIVIRGWVHIGAGVWLNRFSPVPEIESRFLGHSPPSLVPHPSSNPHNRMNQVTKFRFSKRHWMYQMNVNASFLTPSKEMTSTLLFIKTAASYRQ
jgi:hypothetical protein